MVIAPLSTLAHWQREFMNWTGLNTIVYHGTAEDRKHIRELEFAYPKDRPGHVPVNSHYLKRCGAHSTNGPWMVTVVVTTPEMAVCDDSRELMAVKWEVLIVDEAHRMKSQTSRLGVSLRNSGFTFRHKILLTGTPIQNEVG